MSKSAKTSVTTKKCVNLWGKCLYIPKNVENFVTILISKGVFKPIFVAIMPPELYKICNIIFYKWKWPHPPFIRLIKKQTFFFGRRPLPTWLLMHREIWHPQQFAAEVNEILFQQFPLLPSVQKRKILKGSETFVPTEEVGWAKCQGASEERLRDITLQPGSK